MSSFPVFEKKDHPKGGRTYLDDVLPLVVTTLSRILLPDQTWKVWAPVIKDYDGDPKYRMRDIKLLEIERNPVESMWGSLTKDARDLNYVKETLTQAALYLAADFISVNVLGGERVRRPAVRQDAAPNPPLQRLEPPGPLIAPPTEVIEGSSSSGEQPSSTSTTPKDFYDGTPVEYNSEMDHREWNISNSDDSSNQQQGTVRSHMLNIRERGDPIYSRQPVHGANMVDSNLGKNPLQENLIYKIEELLDLNDVHSDPGKPHEFLYKDLSVMTNNFDPRPLSEHGRLIGKGGFGEVFLGRLNSNEIAVKRIKNENNRNISKQFKAEIDAMSWLVHDNLLPLLGYSADGNHLCIVYKYMSKGSLEDALAYKKPGVPPLSIQQRLKIALGTTRGIAHLHTRDPPLVHRDIKSANVLLSEDLTPRIGDFGLARLGPQPQVDSKGATHLVTEEIIGTRAYMPPEAYDGEIAPRWDCYSLGVVIQELVTALPAYDSAREDKLLPGHILETCENAQEFLQLADKKAGPWDLELVSKLYDLSKNCLRHKKSKRWNIKQIEGTLSALMS